MLLSDVVSILRDSGFLKAIMDSDGRPVDSNFKEDPVIKGISMDSREIIPGSIFVCIRGNRYDGHDYAADAARKGAVALISERTTEASVFHILVDDARKSIGHVSSVFYGKPSESLRMIAVTGTNGKTTSAFMMRSILSAAGEKAGLLGTVVYDTGSGAEVEAGRTTPEANQIQKMLFEMGNNGCSSCVMEASSHGLTQGRLSGCSFDAAIFTNLSSEHLDFHKSMDNYFAAKMTLFRDYMRTDKWVAASNVEDPYGRSIKEKFPGAVVSFALEKKFDPDFLGEISSLSISGVKLKIIPRQGKRTIELVLPLTGRFNARNALGSAAGSLAMGLAPEIIKNGLENMPQVPGRLQRFPFSNGVTALIDYAHTPDALQNVLSSIREVCQGRIWVVFGSGGDRFKGNRPLMGKIAATLADRVVITMDNPRSEEPEAIAVDILKGVKDTNGLHCSGIEVILDRKSAVFFALDQASKGDAVLIAGKGPERNIIFSDRVIPYSDSDAILEWTENRGIE